MKRIVAFVMIFVVLTTTFGCSKQDSLVDIYIEAFNILFEEDPGLNGEIIFIAIQMNNLKGIEENDRDKIKKAFEQKGYEVKDASLDDLRATGEFDDKSLIIENGILIKVDEFREFSNSRIVFEASKYRSGTGAIGMLFKFVKDKANWVLEESSGLWIS